jgi:hypothetical protein
MQMPDDEYEALLRGALRYRWLREFRKVSYGIVVIQADSYLGDKILISEDLDAAIDEAMRK